MLRTDWNQEEREALFLLGQVLLATPWGRQKHSGFVTDEAVDSGGALRRRTLLIAGRPAISVEYRYGDVIRVAVFLPSEGERLRAERRAKNQERAAAYAAARDEIISHLLKGGSVEWCDGQQGGFAWLGPQQFAADAIFVSVRGLAKALGVLPPEDSTVPWCPYPAPSRGRWLPRRQRQTAWEA